MQFDNVSQRHNFMPELTHTTHTTTASNENGMWNSDSQTCGTKLPTPSRITNEKKSAHPAGMLQAGSDALKPNVHTIFVFVHKCMDNRCGFYAKSTIRKYAHIPGISQYFLYPLPSTVKDGGVVCALRCMIVLAFNCSINNMNCRILRAI